jgi:hypothetical protein
MSYDIAMPKMDIVEALRADRCAVNMGTGKACPVPPMEEAADEIERLRGKLHQIAAVCRDNAEPTYDQKMALNFIFQIAANA